MANFHFQCTLCAETYGADELTYVCPKHGDAGVLETVVELSRAFQPARHSPLNMWRYAGLLPIGDEQVHGMSCKNSASSNVGWTPLYDAGRLGAALGLKNLWIKDDGRNPSASFKDRASAFVVAKAMERGETTLTTASSGNAGAALACMA